MVEQMVSSNLSKYGLGKCASITTSSDKQPTSLTSIKNTALRDVQNEYKNGPPRPSENSALQKETSFKEAVTQTYQVKSPPSTSNLNRNLVYARRKSDSELGNSRTLDKNRTSGHQQTQQLGDKKFGPQTEAKIKVSNSVQPFTPVPVTSAPTPVRACGNEQSAMVNSPAMEHWNSRFVQLQKYLNQCNSTNPDVYVQKLRTFSPDECDRHAVELETRAIQLMLEEGREIQRVKDLNILAGNNPLRPLTPSFKSEQLL